MAHGTKLVGPNAWTFWRWYEWSCCSCKTCHTLVWGISKAWAKVRVLVDRFSPMCWRTFSSKLKVQHIHGAPLSFFLAWKIPVSHSRCRSLTNYGMWWSAVMQKAFFIDALCSSTIMSVFPVNYQHLSVLFKHVFDHLVLFRPVLFNDWLPTNMNAELSRPACQHKTHTISPLCLDLQTFFTSKWYVFGLGCLIKTLSTKSPLQPLEVCNTYSETLCI